MQRRATLVFLFLMIVFQGSCSAEKIWQAKNSGLSDTDIRSISIFPGEANLICAASLKTVYFSQNAGDSWKEIFSVQGENSEINFVNFDCSNQKILYLATTKGLFVTKNQGWDWQRIFASLRDEAKNVGWITPDSFDSQKIYIGTEQGLYVSRDLGANWQKLGGGLPRSEIKSIAVHPSNSQVLYLANTYGLFKSIDQGLSWERNYVTSHKINDGQDDESAQELSQTDENQNLINCVAIDKHNPKRIYIATGEGVLISHDAGEVWNKLSTQGLNNDYVNFIVVSSEKNGTLYAATQNGVFEFSSNLNNWKEIYQGKTFRDARNLALNMDGKQLFAGTDRGVFKTVDLKNTQKQKEERNAIDEKDETGFEQVLKELALSEPAIGEVREAALRYAEVVHPERIKTLRRNAKVKALLPDVTVDYDKTINYDSGADRYYVGPYDWGFSLSWDIGDLVFNEQVRLIDSNARLMVQLRDDILNEVTRLYYERRKLQTELILTPPDTAEEKLTKVLRLEELTANIDALTGGHFSRQLEK